MWILYGFICLFTVALYFWRRGMIETLQVRTREVDTLRRVRTALYWLWADTEKAVFDYSKDRSALIPGMSRRKKMKPRQTGREGALKALRSRLKKKI